MNHTAPRVKFGSCIFVPTGFGAAARAYMHAMHAAGVELTICNISRYQEIYVPDDLALALLDRPLDAQMILWHTEPNAMTSEQTPLPNTIVQSTWEADALPAHYLSALERVREIWVPSSFNAEVFRRQLNVPVYQIPHPIPLQYQQAESVEELNEGLNLKPSDFVVLAIATWQERKNLDGIIEAFLRAFPDEPDAILVLKTRFSLTSPRQAGSQITAAIQRAGGNRCKGIESRVRVCEGIWPEGKMHALMKRADCYLSLHRGEGWCYPLFEAALSGVPIIATGFSGPMDYLNPRHHHLVRYNLVTPRERIIFKFMLFDETMRWADPDLSHAAELLRWNYENREAARQMAQQGIGDLHQRYSLQTVGKLARERIRKFIAEN